MVDKTYPLLKYYTRNEQAPTEIICNNLDTEKKIKPTDTYQHIHTKRKRKITWFTHHLAKAFLQKSKNLFYTF